MDFDEDPDYLDLDDILAQTQTVNCKFLLNIPGLDFLSPGQVAQNKNLLLPFWMAKTLYTYSMIDIDLPKPYTESYREIIIAEPNAIDLRKHGPYYYHFGKLLMGLRREKGNNLAAYTEEGQRNKFRREEGETLEGRNNIALSLIKTFHHRRHWILEYSTNTSGVNDDHKAVRDFVNRLDNMEKRLFQLGHKQVEDIKKWKLRKIELIGNNVIANQLAKRRKIEIASSTENTMT